MQALGVKAMWYSSIKVGIVEIDMDHYNIDTMLRLYSSDRVPEFYLPQIINGLIKHFDTEEKIIASMGRDFPENHKIEHSRLTQLLNEKLTTWKDGSLAGKVFVAEVREILLLHVAEFDVFLNNNGEQ